MPLIVGNLLTDPDANSFISLADALAYLEVEGAGSLAGTALGDWLLMDTSAQESTLARASRWMALTLPWCRTDVNAAQIASIGHVAARIAVQARGNDLWDAPVIGKTAKRYKADGVEIEYADAGRARGAHAGGRLFPWVYPMLRGLLCGSGSQHEVVRT